MGKWFGLMMFFVMIIAGVFYIETLFSRTREPVYQIDKYEQQAQFEMCLEKAPKSSKNNRTIYFCEEAARRLASRCIRNCTDEPMERQPAKNEE